MMCYIMIIFCFECLSIIAENNIFFTADVISLQNGVTSLCLNENNNFKKTK